MKTSHTPTPWNYRHSPSETSIFAKGTLEEQGEYIATCIAHNRQPEGDVIIYDAVTQGANAAMIVRAVNNHEALLELAQYAVRMAETEADISKGTSAYFAFRDRAAKFRAALAAASEVK